MGIGIFLGKKYSNNRKTKGGYREDWKSKGGYREDWNSSPVRPYYYEFEDRPYYYDVNTDELKWKDGYKPYYYDPTVEWKDGYKQGFEEGRRNILEEVNNDKPIPGLEKVIKEEEEEEEINKLD